jgi:predicted nuclease of predicted toxin-antitoxin system
LRFLIDNALSPSMAEGLKKAGHEAIHVCELGMGTATDKEIMNFALTENRVIVSADTDFGTLLALRDLPKPSFVLFRRSDKRPIALLMQLLSNLAQFSEALETGAVVVIEDKRIRIRPLPIGNIQ